MVYVSTTPNFAGSTVLRKRHPKMAISCPVSVTWHVPKPTYHDEEVGEEVQPDSQPPLDSELAVRIHYLARVKKARTVRM